MQEKVYNAVTNIISHVFSSLRL